MTTFRFDDKTYEVDPEGFLLDSARWDEDFALGMAPRVKIHDGLTERHWCVIKFIRACFEQTCECPVIYRACRIAEIDLAEFERLFPTGFLRGACKLAGLTYKEGLLGHAVLAEAVDDVGLIIDKVYRVDARGYLTDPYDWDRQFALFKAFELKMSQPLTEEHWQIIHFLRDSYTRGYTVPSIFEACRVNGIGLDDLERLFPDGYYRSAVKIAGLRVR
jgi:TusE/DsrC/DsvC family sulfur relay protein